MEEGRKEGMDGEEEEGRKRGRDWRWKGMNRGRKRRKEG